MTAIFPEDFADRLPDDAVRACLAICEAVCSFNQTRSEHTGEVIPPEDRQAYLEALALFEVYTETHPLDLHCELPELDAAEETTRAIVLFFRELKVQLDKQVMQMDLSRYRKIYAMKFGQTVSYQFSDHEIRRIRSAIHELRVLIGDLQKLEAHQRTRLLSRLGRIYGQLDAKLADLDLFWGLVGEALIVNKLYGEAASLIVDSIYDIVNTAWRAQARAESISVAEPHLQEELPASLVWSLENVN